MDKKDHELLCNSIITIIRSENLKLKKNINIALVTELMNNALLYNDAILKLIDSVHDPFIKLFDLLVQNDAYDNMTNDLLCRHKLTNRIFRLTWQGLFLFAYDNAIEILELYRDEPIPLLHYLNNTYYDVLYSKFIRHNAKNVKYVLKHGITNIKELVTIFNMSIDEMEYYSPEVIKVIDEYKKSRS